MMVDIQHRSKRISTFRTEKIRSLFNAENGHEWSLTADLPLEDEEWQIGLVVGPSGSGKTSIGKAVSGDAGIHNLYAGWRSDSAIVDCILPDGNLNEVTGALSSVGLGDVPAWLRPFHLLSNGEQYRAGLARLICEAPAMCVVDEFTSVIDRQIAKIGAAAFEKSWRKKQGRKIILLACHFDIVEGLRPDWVFDTQSGVLKKKLSQGQACNWTFGRSTAVTGSILKSITI